MALTFLDCFAGIGGFRKGFLEAGWEPVGSIEIDEEARAVYRACFEPREWQATDIRLVHGSDLPVADCWTFGPPCQDLSVIKQGREGLEGSQSELYWEIPRLLEACNDKPRWLVLEQVTGLFSSRGGWDFYELLRSLDACGYDAEWDVYSPAEFGIPQDRGRVFLIGHLRGASTLSILPINRIDTREWVGDSQAFFTTGEKGEVRPRVVCTCLDASYGRGFARMGNRSGVMEIGSKTTRLRRLMPVECWRLMGRSDQEWEAVRGCALSDKVLYRLIGNSVCATITRELAKALKYSVGALT